MLWLIKVYVSRVHFNIFSWCLCDMKWFQSKKCLKWDIVAFRLFLYLLNIWLPERFFNKFVNALMKELISLLPCRNYSNKFQICLDERLITDIWNLCMCWLDWVLMPKFPGVLLCNQFCKFYSSSRRLAHKF